MKSKRTTLIFFLSTLIIFTSLTLSSCHTERKTTQEKLAEVVQDRFNDIDQHRYGRTLSLVEAEAYLFCWADENSGMDISDDELREAIWVVLESTNLMRELISEIDEIDLE